MNTNKQILVAPNTAARLLDVSRSTIYNWMKSGRIKFVSIGTDRRILAEELDRIASSGLPK